ncbi:hypothetical protein T484DRAFT_1930886 [Baffinella frigidus]|nr:hypothetical protein T484DRAFT_1930886 [Cryptophyta sp. CCMP2293]
MESQKNSGGGGKSKRSGGGKSKKREEDPMLGEFGMGRQHPKQTCCFVSTVIIMSITVTAWMQTCVPFCGAKKMETGQWKAAWANTTIPLDMQGSMDTTIDPCDDFYKFACGGFTEHTGIKKDQVEWAKAWDGVESRISKELKKEVEADKGKVGEFYRACMDTATIDKLGAKPLKPYLDAIDAIKTQDDLVGVIGMFQEVNVPVYFDWQVMADPKDPTRYVVALLDAGLTLPEAKMYTATSNEFSKMRSQYQKVVENVLVLTGLTPSQAKHAAADAISVEMAIAKHTLPNDKLRSAKAKHYSMAELNKLAPGIKFPEIFRRLGAPNVGVQSDNILCKDPAFLTGISGLMTSPTFWAHKAYLRFKIAYGLGSDLSGPFLQQGLQVGHILTGVEHQTPRWRKCYDSTKNNLPDEVAKLFVAKHLPKANVDAAEKMLQNIRTAFRGVIQAEDWMQPETKDEAVDKLNNMFIQVGHGKWQEYDFPVRPNSFLNNTNNAKRWVISRALKRLDQPVDRERWGSMDPTQVDGSYARQVNGVFVPGGLLQEPFFSSKYPDARNYGSVGCVLGHEFTHGFDNVGRRYDATGRMKDWWTPQDVLAFKKRAKCIVDYYSTFTVHGKSVDGEMTLAENIADSGGVKVSYEALLKLHPKSSEADKQLFFLSWGQTWCSVQRKKTALLALEDDEHAPDSARVNGPLAQYKPFAKAYQCADRAIMNPRARCGDQQLLGSNVIAFAHQGPVW